MSQCNDVTSQWCHVTMISRRITSRRNDFTLQWRHVVMRHVAIRHRFKNWKNKTLPRLVQPVWQGDLLFLHGDHGVLHRPVRQGCCRNVQEDRVHVQRVRGLGAAKWFRIKNDELGKNVKLFWRCLSLLLFPAISMLERQIDKTQVKWCWHIFRRNGQTAR